MGLLAEVKYTARKLAEDALFFSLGFVVVSALACAYTVDDIAKLARRLGNKGNWENTDE